MKKYSIVMAGIFLVIILVIGLFWFNPFSNSLIGYSPKLVPKFTFGSEGDKVGEFKLPMDLLIRNDYLYVADGGNSRIQVLKINPEGKPIPEFVIGKKSTDLGGFDSPLSLATSGDFLYVADTGNSRIQLLKINPDGSLSAQSSFGKQGTGLGEFDRPRGLAISGNFIYVSDLGNNRIQILKINPDGSLSAHSSFGKKGVDLGEFDEPFGLTIWNSYLFVVDSQNGRIQVLNINPDGSLSAHSSFGKQSAGLGEFFSPSGVFIRDNRLYVIDSGNRRIQIFNINPDVRLSAQSSFNWKKGKALGEFYFSPFSLFLKDNFAYVTDPGGNRIQVLKVNSDGTLSTYTSFGKKGKGLGELDHPSCLIFYDKYLFVADSENNYIQTLEADDAGNLVAKHSFGKGLGKFDSLSALAIKGDFLYAADSQNSRIQAFKIGPDGSLAPQFAFGKRGDGVGEFKEGFLDLAIKDDFLFVADSDNNRIQTLKIDSDGRLAPLFAYGREGSKSGEFKGNPTLRLAIKDDYLYVADPGNSRIQILRINKDGSLSARSSFGKKGDRLGEFGFFPAPFNSPAPFDLAVKDGYLFVADSIHCRIQIFKIKPNGSLVPKSSFGKGGKGLGEFLMPMALYIEDDLLYVAEWNNRIHVLEIQD